MIRGHKSKAVIVSALLIVSMVYTNCAKHLPPEANQQSVQGVPPSQLPQQPTPLALAASYNPALVYILSSTTVSPVGGTAPYTMSKLSGSGTFSEVSGVYSATNTPELAVIRVVDSLGAYIDVQIQILPLNVVASEQSFAQSGSYSFTVPTYNTLVVEVWGGGAGGQHCGLSGFFPFCLYGGGGGTSTFGENNLVAQGGQGVNGGDASGGSLNVKGENGNWNGSNCPGYGGAAGGPAGPLLNTRRAGGAGGGGDSLCLGWGANGGGGGGYTVKEYRAGDLAVGSVIPGVVGGGGGVGGANGLVKIRWQ